MATIAEWVKKNTALNEGAKITDLETLVSDLDPLKNLKTDQEKESFIKRNFQSQFDQAVTAAVKTHDEKFTAEKLPGLLKAEGDKVRKEINPDETPEQKRIKDLETRIADSDAKTADNEIKAQLRAKAKELKSSVDADRYSVYGDKALEYLEADITAQNALLEQAKAEAKKEVYGGTPPPPSGEPVEPADLDKQIMEARQAGNATLSMKLQQQKTQLQQEKPQQ